MPCWVVPAIAAELWGVSLEHVVGAIADGSLSSRLDCGFVVVDVAPERTGPPPAPRAEGPPPQTYVVVQREAYEAPAQELAPVPEAAVEPLVQIEAVEAEDPEIPQLDQEEDDKPITNWREVRARVGRDRVPPRRKPPAVAA